MIKHNIEIPQTKFYTLLVVYRIHLTDNEMYRVYNIFKDIFQYNTTFTYIDEDTELLKFSVYPPKISPFADSIIIIVGPLLSNLL